MSFPSYELRSNRGMLSMFQIGCRVMGRSFIAAIILCHG